MRWKDLLPLRLFVEKIGGYMALSSQILLALSRRRLALLARREIAITLATRKDLDRLDRCIRQCEEHMVRMQLRVVIVELDAVHAKPIVM